MPSSPTSSTEATIAVRGENVDYYRYRLGGGSWSDEVPVGDSIELSGLSEGTVNLYVKGRSRYGGYLADDQAVRVSGIDADGRTVHLCVDVWESLQHYSAIVS